MRAAAVASCTDHDGDIRCQGFCVQVFERAGVPMWWFIPQVFSDQVWAKPKPTARNTALLLHMADWIQLSESTAASQGLYQQEALARG